VRYVPRNLKYKWCVEHRYAGAMVDAKTVVSEGRWTVEPDRIGRIPIRYPFESEYFFRGAQGRYTPILTESNHQIGGVSYPYYADTSCVLEFDRGQLNRPNVIGALATETTGHIMGGRSVHSMTKLPQGQSWVYSNICGAEAEELSSMEDPSTAPNFWMLHTDHSQGDHRSFILLNTFPSPKWSGDTPVDYVQMTSANLTEIMTEELHIRSGLMQDQ
jgi:hypothetical protein